MENLVDYNAASFIGNAYVHKKPAKEFMRDKQS